MSLAARGARAVNRAARCLEPVAELPVFLCPGLLRYARPQRQQPQYDFARPNFVSTRRRFHGFGPSGINKTEVPTLSSSSSKVTALPEQCAGCGALSQTLYKDEPGYFSLKRNSVKEFLGLNANNESLREELFIQERLKSVDEEIAQSLEFKKPIRESKYYQ